MEAGNKISGWRITSEVKSRFSFWHLFTIGFVLFIFTSSYTYINWGWRNSETPFRSDAAQYYSYLPSWFGPDKDILKHAREFWPIVTPTGRLIPKMPLGVALLEMPYYLAGDFIAGKYDYLQDGYSPPYTWSVYFGTILYVYLGLWLLYRSLKIYFSGLVSTLTAGVLFFATNLFFYTVSFGQMAHSFLFFLFSVFLFFSLKFYRQRKPSSLYIMAFTAGLITITRPTGIIVVLFPLLTGVTGLVSLREWWSFLWSKKLNLMIAVLLYLAALSPQLIYWKINTGRFYFDTYTGEKFFFNDPQIINFLFSYRKGLFLYSPILLFGFAGLPLLYRKFRGLFLPVVVYCLVIIYVLSCWWDWSFGGSFGNRALIESFPFFAFGIAAVINELFVLLNKGWKLFLRYAILVPALGFFIILNLRMTEAYNAGAIHWSGMTREAYWFVFMKSSYNAEEYRKLVSMYHEPDTEAQKKGLKRDF